MQLKKILITGVTGSGGSYLAEHIVHRVPGVEVHGTSRWHSTSSAENVASIVNKITLHECDLTDLGSVISVLRDIEPNAIFHLAAYANVRQAFTTPLSVLNNNIMGTANLLEGIRLTGIDPIVQLCSTSEVYGQVDPKLIPIKEDCPLQPVNPYAVSKLAQDALGLCYFRSYGQRIFRTRMFSYINPRRADLFATSFAMQVARVEVGLQDELIHGNLDTVRTLIDVRDAMEAYYVAVLHCQPGEAYNIGGTTVISVGEFLEVLKKLSHVPIRSRQDPKLLRPVDVTLQIPSVDKFHAITNWKPQYSFNESVAFLLDHCRREVAFELAAQSSRK